jgi:hypothetical protein
MPSDGATGAQGEIQPSIGRLRQHDFPGTFSARPKDASRKVDGRQPRPDRRFRQRYSNESDPPARVAGYAKYILKPGKFSYTYEGWTAVTQKASGTSVSEHVPWQGLRTFTASVENHEIRFRATNGPQEFKFTASGLSYSDGKQTKVYRRVSDK